MTNAEKLKKLITEVKALKTNSLRKITKSMRVTNTIYKENQMKKNRSKLTIKYYRRLLAMMMLEQARATV